MRYLVGFLFVCALGLVPLSASAQAGEEGTATEPNLQEPASSSEPAPEEPALQLKLDSVGVEVVPSPPRTADGYTLEEMERRVMLARVGLGVSGGAFVLGGVLAAAGGASLNVIDGDSSLIWAGVVLGAAGAAGMIASGILLGKRKRKLRRLQEANYGRPHGVQWDLAQSRLVF